MLKIKIADIQKVRHQTTGTDFLDVEVHIFEEGAEPVNVQKHAFDPAISKEELTAKVEAILAGYILEQEQKEANKEENAVNENVYDLQAELVGKEITVEAKVEDKQG